jgi:enamine deaminase RidA (YjgF/YER057c/UK114 family)
MSPERKLQELHLKLPPAPKAMAVYKPVVIVGTLAYLSGHGPLKEDEKYILGTVGRELNLEDGYRAARQTGLAILSTLRAGVGSLDRVKRLIKTLGLVNCTSDFKDQPKVINGFSDLMVEVFGPDLGIGARSAVGAVALPNNMAVEIECIFELH